MASDGDKDGGKGLAFRREVALLLSEVNTRRDPKEFKERQLPRLRRLLQRFKKTIER